MGSRNGTLLEETGEQMAVPDRFIVTEPEVQSVESLADLKVKKDQLVVVDGPFCENFLDEATYPRFEGEREYRRRHAQDLMRAILRQTYRPEHVILMLCDVGGVEYRINGQHTCGAILSLTQQHPGTKFNMRLIRYKAKSMKQMKALYASVDNGASRTPSNKIVAQIAGEPGFADYANDVIRRLGEGMRFYAGDTPHQRRQLDPQVTATLMLTRYRQHCLLAAKLITDKNRDAVRHMLRSPVIASIIAAADVAKGPAEVFYRGVRDGVKMGEDDPMLKARDYLMNTAIRDTGGASDKRAASSEQVYRAMHRAWQAFREGTPLRGIKNTVAMKTRPVFS